MSDIWGQVLNKSENNNVFQTWEWIYTWWKYFGDGRTLLLLLLMENGEVVGIAPLMFSKKRLNFINLGLIEFIGTGLSDYGDFILLKDKKECINLIFDFLEKTTLKWDLIDLRHIPKESTTADLLQEVAEERGYLSIREETTCLFISLPKTLDEFFKRLSTKMRKNLRNEVTRINKSYSTAMKSEENSGDLVSSVNTFLSLYQGWLTERHNLSTIFDLPFPKIKEFLIDLALVFSSKGWMNLTILSFNQEPVSAQFNFIYNKSFYQYMVCRDPSYSQFGVGNVHNMHLIERSIQLGLQRFDFLRGDEPYKVRWEASKRTNIRTIISKKGLKGRLFKIYQSLKH
jgi:CelD/BcsL family acetyltransferase involved in cellulose biosynthesis